MAGYERQVKEMAVTLSSQEVAALTGKTERTVRRWAESGKIPAERVLNKFNSPEYLFSLDALEPHLQQKYFDGLKLTPSPAPRQPTGGQLPGRGKAEGGQAAGHLFH